MVTSSIINSETVYLDLVVPSPVQKLKLLTWGEGEAEVLLI